MRLRVALLVLSLATAAVLLTWTGTFLYWDLKIRRAVQDFLAESRGNRKPYLDYNVSARTLTDAGCRSLPYLVSALQNPADQEALTYALCWVLEWRTYHDPSEDEEVYLAMKTMEQTLPRTTDSPEERRRKALRIREWWAERGGHFHQWWRVWSSDCSGTPKDR